MGGAGGRRSRWSNLFGLGSVPGSQEETRDHLRKRVSLYFQVTFFIYTGVYGMAVVFVAARGSWPALGHPARWVHVGVILGALAMWFFTRRAGRTVGQLAAAELLGTLAIAAGVGMFGFLSPAAALEKDDLELVLALTQTLIARAVIVPSTATRTLALGIVCTLPLTGALFVAGRAMARATGLPSLLSVVEALTWLTISVLLSGMASRVIYGLRRRVAHFARLGQYTLGEQDRRGRDGRRVPRQPRACCGGRRRSSCCSRTAAGDRATWRASSARSSSRATSPIRTRSRSTTSGGHRDGVFYYVMEYLDGLDLEALVRGDGPLRRTRVVHVLGRSRGALAEAHGVGLIHRDIKPANIILCQRGRSRDFVKVVDFGLVRDLSQSPAESIDRGGGMGTPLYLAPEAISRPETSMVEPTSTRSAPPPTTCSPERRCSRPPR